MMQIVKRTKRTITLSCDDCEDRIAVLIDSSVPQEELDTNALDYGGRVHSCSKSKRVAKAFGLA